MCTLRTRRLWPQEVTAKDYAESLIQVEDLPDLKKIKALHKALKRADEEWISSFRDNGGMAGIYKVCRLQ